MKFDNLSKCSRCDSDACYIQEINSDITLKFCYGCGFQSNSIMTKDSEFYKEQISILPEIYKDLIYEDDKGGIWIPSTINVEEKGIVFAMGNDKTQWDWAAAKVKEVSEEEKEKFKNANFRADMTTLKKFKERDFMDALSYIGVLPE
tara:strand:- start:57 stop:497 length:441 start_codon:yes stop_codon:yes gene_type:complete